MPVILADPPKHLSPRVLRLHRLYPALKVSGLQSTLGPYRRPENLAKYEEAMRKAGLMK